MPWLKKDEVLLIHVPRCGGTSLSKHHRVGKKAQEGKNLWRRFGIKYFNYRYKLLEKTNFPLLTIENAIALFMFTLASVLFVLLPAGIPVPFVMWTSSCSTFIMSTFIWTAPVLMRTDIIRVFFMYVQHYVLCKFNADEDYLTGVNIKGYLLHLTAERCIRYGYVSEEDIKAKSFSIVRNPYSRAVSMYEYNKRPCETFDHFIKDFNRKCMKTYHKKQKTDSKDIYCHVIPMHAYTHINGKQVVNTIIKQEQLKRLVATEWADSGVPVKIQQAMTGIPHANSRKKKMPWQEYYNQRTMDLVLQMYQEDFEIFGYDKHIPKRPDLIPAETTVADPNTEFTECREAGTLLRKPTLGAESTEVSEGNDSNFVPGAYRPIIREKGNKNVRRVSISKKIEKKVFEPMEEVDSRPTVKRATSAGEALIETRSTICRRLSQTDLSKPELLSKKRAASAFVLQQVSAT